MFSASAVIKKSEHQVSCSLDNEVAILETKSALYFGLNKVGTHVWQLLKDPHSVHHICDSVADHFDVDPSTCRADVVRFLTSMQQAGLIEVTSQEQPSI